MVLAREVFPYFDKFHARDAMGGCCWAWEISDRLEPDFRESGDYENAYFPPIGSGRAVSVQYGGVESVRCSTMSAGEVGFGRPPRRWAPPWDSVGCPKIAGGLAGWFLQAG